ncbi:MAG TPA: Do family serine endopeptidase [Thermohalobaculum sp.]|nr:Do family serine endopeptidase [Thermohalobaculum sp.]
MSSTATTQRRLALGGIAAGVMLVTAAPASAQDRYVFADLADKVSPAVVNIFTTTEPPEAASNEGEGMEMPEAFRDFLERFGFENMPQVPGMPGGHGMPPGPRNALGSGFVFEADGYVITNNHVVEGADEVKVRFENDEEYPAEVIGLDPATDLALLKIEAEDDLPYVELGSSDGVRVGERVMAVGNPFGLGGTVTTGIVSAKGRDINAGPYVDFIQTDAAINRGNSGGPLFNMDGEVIGVNSAIYSPTGTNVGVGFAIPSNVVEMVVADLKDDGQVDRGWLGVQIQEVTPEIAQAVGLEDARGTIVADVMADSPSVGKLEAGDVIVEYDGTPVGETRDLPRLVAATEAGSEVELGIWRDGEQKTVEVTIGALDTERLAMAAPSQQPKGEDPESSEELGATLAGLDPETRKSLGIDDDAEGVVVTSLKRGGAAADAGLRVGDVILEIGSEPVARPDEVGEVLSGLDSEAALLKVNRNGNVIFVGVRLAGA